MKDYIDYDLEQENFSEDSVNGKKCYNFLELSEYLSARAKDPDTKSHLEQCAECAKRIATIKTGRSLSSSRKEIETDDPKLKGRSLSWLISQPGYPINNLKASDLEIKDEDLTAGM